MKQQIKKQIRDEDGDVVDVKKPKKESEPKQVLIGTEHFSLSDERGVEIELHSSVIDIVQLSELGTGIWKWLKMERGNLKIPEYIR